MRGNASGAEIFLPTKPEGPAWLINPLSKWRILKVHPETAQRAVLAGPVPRSTVTEQLRNRRDMLELELARVNEALSAMEANPETAKLVDQLSQIGHFSL